MASALGRSSPMARCFAVHASCPRGTNPRLDGLVPRPIVLRTGRGCAARIAYAQTDGRIGLVPDVPGSPIVDKLTLAHQYVFMRTTIDLPDGLFRQAKAHAALQGVSLKDLITRYVEAGLAQAHGPITNPSSLRRLPPPIAIPSRGTVIPALSPATLRAIEEADDETSHARSA